MSKVRFVASAALVLVFISGCASSQQKLRREQREKAIQSAKLYCEFLNGEQYPDIDVALNLAMAQKCDADKAFSITNYKTPSDIIGMMYCCSVTNKAAGVKEAKSEHAIEARAEAKASEKLAEKPVLEKPVVAPPPAAKKPEVAPAAAPQQQATTTTAAQEPATRTEVKSEAKAEAKTKTEVKTDSKQPARDPDLDE